MSQLLFYASDLSVFVDGRNIPDDILDSFIVSLEIVYRELVVLETTSQLSTSQSEATKIVRNCLSSLRCLNEQRTYLIENGFCFSNC